VTTQLAIRRAGPADTRLFIELHHRSVRGLAPEYYAPDVINAWAPPVTEDALRDLERNDDDEIRLIAELEGAAVGIGALVVADSELRACYVIPDAARRGVGTAIVKEIERIAIADGLTMLTLQSSINAEPFYAALGYQVIERGDHILRGGQRMAAVMMVKRLTQNVDGGY
jgi:putative acetyltransferase